jgi:hypothetical protein
MGSIEEIESYLLSTSYPLPIHSLPPTHPPSTESSLILKSLDTLRSTDTEILRTEQA